MKNEISNLELSYEMQSANYTVSNEETLILRKSWFEKDTVDFWRHHRMFAPLIPLLEHYKNSNWLTVGDGRYGLDSIRLKEMQPGLKVLPTDLSTVLLQFSKENNLISEYRKENAEALSFADDTFDFAFCKESYHHFPRPYIALYEMLRVAKEGIIFIEPNDKRERMIPEKIMISIKKIAKKILGRPIPHEETWSFEVSGNYIYTTSKNEMEKVALGLQLPTVAFCPYNDYYEKGVEFEKAIPGNKLFEKVKSAISRADLRSKLGLQNYNCMVSVIFKKSPDQELRKQLIQSGFQVIDLPENPYLKKRRHELV